MELRTIFIALILFQCARTQKTRRVNISLDIFEELVDSFKHWPRILQAEVSGFVQKNELNNLISFAKPTVTFGEKAMDVMDSASDPLKSKCVGDIEYYFENLKSHWAAALMDANGKVPSGVLNGDLLWLGNYRECTETYAPAENSSQRGNFYGRYCSSVWNIALPSNMRIREVPLRKGICVPETCSSLEIKDIIQSILKLLERAPFFKQFSGMLRLGSIDCNLGFQKPDGPAVTFLIILGVFFLFAVLASTITAIDHIISTRRKTYQRLNSLTNGTVNDGRIFRHRSIITDEEQIPVLVPYELEEEQTFLRRVVDTWPKYQSYFPICGGIYVISSFKKIIKCFCLFTNAAKLLDTDSSSANLMCIHGIRFLSMSWVILGHAYEHGIYSVENSVDVLKDADNWPFQVIMQATFSVDSFFLISGFLLAYLYLEQADKRDGKINWLGLCLHRYLRLTPVYAVLIGFNSLVFTYTGSGPFWHETSDVKYCKERWWWNLLYINNFIPLKSMCVAWTWYLANEMQFFIVCSSLLYVLWRWPKFGLGIFSCLLLSSWIITWTISEAYHMPPFFFGLTQMKNYTQFQDEINTSWDLVYSKPYCRIGPYLIGILLAFVLYTTGRKPLLKWWIQALGWCAASFCCLSVIYGLYHVPYNQNLFNLYNALSRSSFTLGLAWVIYACLTGHGGPVNCILSLKLWIPLSRMTYCAYLFHPLIMSWYFQSQKVPFYFTHEIMVLYFLAFMVMSYASGFLLSLIFEAPVVNLEKILFKS